MFTKLLTFLLKATLSQVTVHRQTLLATLLNLRKLSILIATMEFRRLEVTILFKTMTSTPSNFQVKKQNSNLKMESLLTTLIL